MRTILVAIAGCCIMMTARAQVVDTPCLKSGDVPGSTVTHTGHYDGNALYGYMDGGAELYREYGFVDLTVQELEIGNEQLLVELFRMRDSLASFGIFSVFRGDCQDDKSTTLYWCQSPGQVIGIAGRYFFRVQRMSTGQETSRAVRAVAKTLVDVLPDSSLRAIPWIVGKSAPAGWQHHAVYACGPLGLQNGFPDWADPLEAGEYLSITIVPWNIENTPVIIGWIRCTSDRAAARLESQLAAHTRPGWKFLRRCHETALLVIESELTPERVSRFAETLLNN
jgi:hypothetical protein